MPGVVNVNAATADSAVTASDSTVLPPTRALYVTVTGDVVVSFVDTPGVSSTYPSVPANTLLPFSVVKVKAATTATVRALY